ncbi:RNA 2',3'-cyclic phosphodiesterase [Mesobacillus subterraneus]|uniref:RNA 2',3'-cyclic phosphodiesterase n=1 Tax=Mesobacillus subterraneus TaxID=285983 RepID=A0A3R9FJF6_9BACI|nr:RNA 2',3'-cyclic phosphodiesterase [Mesobacillus subterraneus]RSD27775.1 RNA 2',3'-cyclic phosphodiesterase [Mesobacillus subterraneus]
MAEQHAHYFYALELPAQVKERLGGTISSLEEEMPFKTWVHPQDLHITLAFLGNAPTEKIEHSNLLMEEALTKHGSFQMTIDHLGIFGKKDAPRIFWAGLEESPELSELRKDVFSACIAAGFTLETRPFSPHITMARKWTGEQSFTSEKLEAVNPFKREKILFHAERVVLYKTHLGKSPKYEPITPIPLTSRPC